ncbi:hypothetical protein AMEX_G9408, partial [Astyanax mexicanus]
MAFFRSFQTSIPSMSYLLSSVSETMDDIASALGDVTFTVSGEIAEHVNTIIHKVQAEEMERLRKKEAAEKEAAALERETYLRNAELQPQASINQAQDPNANLGTSEIEPQTLSSLPKNSLVCQDEAEIQTPDQDLTGQPLEVEAQAENWNLETAKIQPEALISQHRSIEISKDEAEISAQALSSKPIYVEAETWMETAEIQPKSSFSQYRNLEISLDETQIPPQASSGQPLQAEAETWLETDETQPELLSAQCQNMETLLEVAETQPQALSSQPRDSETFL